MHYNSHTVLQYLRVWASLVVVLCASATSSCSAASSNDKQPAADAQALGADASRRADADLPTACVPTDEVADSYSDTILENANNPWNEAENYWEVSAELEETGGPVFELRLHPGRGQLADPIVPGTYNIGVADSRFENCALCTYVTVDGPGGTSYFMADSGTLSLSTIAFGDVVDVIEGELLEATFRAVRLSATGPSCQSGTQCGNTSCASNGKCLVQEATDTCGTSIGQLKFRTP